jgi:hypothetical protein
MKPAFIALLFFVCSCSQVKEKMKEGVHKAGEAGGTVLKEVSSGVSQAFDISIELSSALEQAGISLGKSTLSSSANASDNVLNLYVIFNKDFTGNIVVKVFDSKGLEMGRAKTILTGKKDEAKYIPVNFDAQTNIDSDSKVKIEQ